MDFCYEANMTKGLGSRSWRRGVASNAYQEAHCRDDYAALDGILTTAIAAGGWSMTGAGRKTLEQVYVSSTVDGKMLGMQNINLGEDVGEP